MARIQQKFANYTQNVTCHITPPCQLKWADYMLQNMNHFSLIQFYPFTKYICSVLHCKSTQAESKIDINRSLHDLQTEAL